MGKQLICPALKNVDIPHFFFSQRLKSEYKLDCFYNSILNYDSYIGYFFSLLHALIPSFQFSGLVLCVGARTSGIHNAVLCLLSSLNVEFLGYLRDQRPQFKFLYYLWPN